jgi:hypothetical protein
VRGKVAFVRQSEEFAVGRERAVVAPMKQTVEEVKKPPGLASATHGRSQRLAFEGYGRGYAG